MKTALVIQHVAFEDLGALAEVLKAADFSVHVTEAALADFARLAKAPADLLIVLGGPIGAHDDRDFPFLAAETGVIAERLAARKPTLGICLGAQLMARALGAAVYPAAGKEMGWSPLTLTDAGQASCLAHLESRPVLHWHTDTFDLPESAERLASTPTCPNQAFSYGASALALQFHPEVTQAGMERWFIGHSYEIGSSPGISVGELRRDTARHAAPLARRAREMVRCWLTRCTRETSGPE